jgi:hypothetical protein
MRILFVTSYPPPFDARTRAATAHVRALRADGHVVEVLSPAPSAAHHHEELRSWWSVARMMGRFRRFDRVVVDDELGESPPLRTALRAAASVETWRAPVGAAQWVDEPNSVWPSDRDAAMAEIRARAAHHPMSDSGHATARGLSAPMRRVPPFVLPDPGSARRGAGTVKRVVRRLTGWQVDPLVARMNQLRATLIDEFETLERRDGR